MNKHFKMYLKMIILTIIMIINYSCTKMSIKETPKNVTNSYYKQNGLPELKYNLGENQSYFGFVNDTESGFVKGKENKEYLNFYKNKNMKGYGDTSAYWRWEASFTQKQMDAIINNNLYDLGKIKPKNVYTLKNGRWVSGSVGENPVGTVKTVKAVRRGQSGIIMDLLIEGSKGKFVVTKENNIRRVMAFSKSSLENTGTPKLIGKNGKTLSCGALFPSAFFYVEKKSSTFKIYGGGFGHGVGVPQWGVKELASSGKDYEDILQRYYRGASLSRASSIKGVSKDVRVGITSNSNPQHKSVTLSSTDKMVLKSGWNNKSIPKNKKVVFEKNGGNIVAKVDGKVLMSSEKPITVDSSDMIKVNSIVRSIKSKNPSYRGKFEIAPYGSKNLLLINEVNLEEYLYQVVGSEMPVSFGLEALKVQAVAARTYAVNGVLEGKYKKYNFDLIDTVGSQVYNNLDESEVAKKAVSSTKGKVLTYKSKVIPTFFYSTSAGYSATPQEIW